jgi:hypothetical protein
MSESATKLQEIGIQKISEQTHISKQHIEALIQENFKALNKVQFLGFISIIERDYGINLSELRAKGLNFYGESEAVKPASVFIEKKSKKSSKALYILVAFVIFIAAIYYSIDSDKVNKDVNATQVETVTQEIEALVENNISEMNSSDLETNQSIVSQDEEDMDLNATVESFKTQAVLPAKEIATANDSLRIIAKKRLWFGYIELDTENKTQKVFSGELDLDSKKNWLLLFGHNNIEIELNGEMQTFEKSKNVQFLYKDGVLTQISLDEFKKLNKGEKW